MLSGWQEIQTSISNCVKCESHPRVECNIRQKTPPPIYPIKLLVVGVAPPFVKGVTKQKRAESATNNRNDNLRKFLEETLRLEWDELTKRGLTFLHAVKCAIRPKDRHQNPPLSVVTKCVPQHFAEEFTAVKPRVVITLGERPLQAVKKTPHCEIAKFRMGPIKDIRGDYLAHLDDQRLRLFVTFFPGGGNQQKVKEDVKEAASMAGII